MRKEIIDLIKLLFFCLFLANSQQGIEHIITRIWAGAPPKHIEDDSELERRKSEIELALKNIQEVRQESPEYFQTLTNNLESTIVSSMMKNLDEFMGGTKTMLEKSTLSVKNFFYWSKKKLNGSMVDIQNATLDMGYAAEVALKKKPIQFSIWAFNLFLLGYLFSKILYAILGLIFYKIELSLGENTWVNYAIKFFNGIVKGFHVLVAAIPCGWILLWVVESIFEAKAGSILGLDKLISVVYGWPDFTEIIWYGSHTYRDSIFVPVILVIIFAYLWTKIGSYVISLLEPYLPTQKICFACERPL